MAQDLEGALANHSERQVPCSVAQPTYHHLCTVYVLKIKLKVFKAILLPKGLAK